MTNIEKKLQAKILSTRKKCKQALKSGNVSDVRYYDNECAQSRLALWRLDYDKYRYLLEELNWYDYPFPA